MEDTIAIPCAPIFSLHPRSILRVANRREMVNEYVSRRMWDIFSKNHCFVVNRFALDASVEVRAKVSLLIREMEKAIPMMVNVNASVFNKEGIVIMGESTVSLDNIHPDKIVPMASRFKAFVRFLSSSLVGTTGLKLGSLIKQKNIIRNE